jgi:glutathione S-transferase
MIDFHTSPTSNGWKVVIALEEMGLAHKSHIFNLSKRTQHDEWFLQMNPDGRIPVIVDHDNKDDLTIFLRPNLSCCTWRRKVGSSCGQA